MTEKYIEKNFTLSFMWFDCFGNQLNEGDDIIIAVKEHGRITMHSGIIHELNNEKATISYNKWKAGKEVVRRKYIQFPGLNQELLNIYKIK